MNKAYFKSGYLVNTYYPIFEIIAASLAQCKDKRDIQELTELLKKAKVVPKEEDGVLIFTILPEIKPFDSEEKLRQYYGLIKQILRAA